MHETAPIEGFEAWASVTQQAVVNDAKKRVVCWPAADSLRNFS